MHDGQSLSHVRWDCKYHIVIVPKYRKKVLYGRVRRKVGEILRELCRQRGVEFVEGSLSTRPHPHVSEDSAEVPRGICDRISEGQERGSDPPDAGRETADGSAFLVARVLREHDRLGRLDRPRVHPPAGAGRDRARRVGFQVKHLWQPPKGAFPCERPALRVDSYYRTVRISPDAATVMKVA